ncbi:MAG: hypothetical protein Q4A88_09520 [Clostridia bacterium]|nr:hypothetical protein [Clostridia bacterium]
MKRILTLTLVLTMLLCTTAFAETYKIQHGVDMEIGLTDGTLYVGFAVTDVSDIGIIATIYDEVSYDLVDVHNLDVGDTLETADGDIEVTSKETDEYGDILINGGEEAGGVTLLAADEDNCYHAMTCELVEKMAMGQAQLTLADQVTISIYKHDDSLAPVGEGYDAVTVAAADVAGQLALFADEYTPYQTRATVENGVLTEITVDYAPALAESAELADGVETLTLDSGISFTYNRYDFKVDVDENGDVAGMYLGETPKPLGFNIVIAEDTDAEAYMTEAAAAHEAELSKNMCFDDENEWLIFNYRTDVSEEYTSEVTVYARNYDGGCYIVTAYYYYENSGSQTGEEEPDGHVEMEQLFDSLSFSK